MLAQRKISFCYISGLLFIAAYLRFFGIYIESDGLIFEITNGIDNEMKSENYGNKYFAPPLKVFAITFAIIVIGNVGFFIMNTNDTQDHF